MAGDGGSSDGATSDGATSDGATSDGATSDGATSDGGLFTIGGSIVGLASGDQVVLKDNGSDVLFLASNTAFTFLVPLANGASFDVTVAGNPTTPTPQACTVTNATGTVAGANVVNVAVACQTTCSATAPCAGSQACVGGFCTFCTATSQCTAVQVCILGGCGPCTTDAQCGAGLFCESGSCAAGCTISAASVSPAALNPADPCQSCQPTVSTSGWSNLADGTTGCPAGQVCAAGVCASDIYVGGMIYPSGTLDPANACQSAQPSVSTTSWTNLADGSSCGVPGEICVAGVCSSDCDIGGQIYSPGTVNTNNICQSCQPSASTGGWSSVMNGKSCGSGLICTGGNCGSGCEIAGMSYASGALEPGNACASCQPGVSTGGWTGLANGTFCAVGEICGSESCVSDIYVGGTLYPAGTINPANACQSAQPSVNNYGWSNMATGTPCNGGTSICVAGSCVADCDIGGSVVSSGTLNPSNACQSCQSAASTSTWSTVANGTSCGTPPPLSTATCSGASCVDTCLPHGIGVDRSDDNSTGQHLYTTNNAEAACCGNHVEALNYYYLFPTNVPAYVSPWYRCDNGIYYLYTPSPTCEEWNIPAQSLMGYIADEAYCNAVPLYRLYDPTSGDHFYTLSSEEVTSAEALGYHFEIIAGYVWTTPQ